MRNGLLLLILLITVNCYSQTEKITIRLENDIFLILEKSDFKLTDQTVDYYNDQIPIGLNNRIIFGTDGEIPTSGLTKATLKIRETIHQLKIDDMYNLWFMEVNERFFNIKKEGNQFRLTGIFSDGAGTYAAEWLIIENSNIRTLLTANEEEIIEILEDK